MNIRKTWRRLFKERILERGEEYAENGAVEDLRKEDDTLLATVAGTYLYDVEITLNNGYPEHMSCTCPYAKDGHNCKHMAAVLYTAEEWDEKDSYQWIDPDEEVSNILDCCTKADLVSFLTEQASENDKLTNRILVKFAENFSETDVDRLNREADVIMENSSDLEQDLQRFLAETVDVLQARGFFPEAFQVSAHVIKSIEEISINEETFTSICEICTDTWREILDYVSAEDREKIHQWLLQNADNSEHLTQFLQEEFPDRDELYRQLRDLDIEIDALGNAVECPVEINKQGKSITKVEKLIELMKKLGATDEQIADYKYEHRSFRVIREELIKEAKRTGNRTELRKLAEEGLTLEPDNQEYRHILAETEPTKDARKAELSLLLDMVGKNIYLDTYTYLQIKELCTASEWLALRSQLIESLPLADNRCELYFREDMMEELWQLIRKEQNLFLLNQYSIYFKGEHDPEILQMYEELLNQYIPTAKNRNAYQTITDSLDLIQNFSGGEKLVNLLVYDWVKRYRTRKALMEELKQYL